MVEILLALESEELSQEVQITFLDKLSFDNTFIRFSDSWNVINCMFGKWSCRLETEGCISS